MDVRTGGGFPYDAFITYSHVQVREATRLQRLLQAYRLPRKRGSPPRRLKVYLDQTDIRSGPLSQELDDALSSSRTLVVCCSTAASTSAWVRREIDSFTSRRDNPLVAAVLLSDTQEQAIPEAVRKLDVRLHDLRRAWRAGLLRSRARDEVVRLVAFVADVPLRELIPWDRRLRWRRAWRSAAVTLSAAAALLLFPVPTWRRVDVGLEKMTPGPRSVVSCDVVGGELVLVTRYEHCRDGGCVIHTSADSVRADGSTVKIADATYSPRRRLVYAGVAPYDLAARAHAAFPGLPDRNAWIGEPAPDGMVAVTPLHAPWLTPDEDTPWPNGQSRVLVRRSGRLQSSDVDGLYATWESPAQQPFSGEPPLPSADFSIAWSPGEIWLGSTDGLWRSADGGRTWEAQPDFGGTLSILADSTSAGPGRVLVAEMAPIPSLGGPPPPRELRLVERRTRGAAWRAFSGPPVGSQSQVEFCGTPADGKVVVRVDTWLYRRARLPLLRGLLRRAEPY